MNFKKMIKNLYFFVTNIFTIGLILNYFYLRSLIIKEIDVLKSILYPQFLVLLIYVLMFFTLFVFIKNIESFTGKENNFKNKSKIFFEILFFFLKIIIGILFLNMV